MNNKHNIIEELRELEMSGFISYEEMVRWTNNVQKHLRFCGDTKNKIRHHTTSFYRVVM